MQINDGGKWTMFINHFSSQSDHSEHLTQVRIIHSHNLMPPQMEKMLSSLQTCRRLFSVLLDDATT